MGRWRRALPALLVVAASGWAGAGPTPAHAVTNGITFGVPSLVDPVHTYGEPDIAIDNNQRVWVSGPTGTGVQRSTWSVSNDGGHTYRAVNQCPGGASGCPNPAFTTPNQPGGGDTEIVFDNHNPEGVYYSDLYALTCFRVAATHNGGATTEVGSTPLQQYFPGGCAGNKPTADRQWQVVYDPPAGVGPTSAYKGPKPLVYLEYNGGGALWNKSSKDTCLTPGSCVVGVDYNQADAGKSHFGNDGYPAIDQVTGKVFEAAGAGGSLLLNIGTPDASGNLHFLDDAGGGGLITIRSGLAGSPDTHWTVLSMDSARNLIASWAIGANDPTKDQVFVSAASAASGWTNWTSPVQVSDGTTSTGDAVNTFAWNVAGGPGRDDVAWYGSDQSTDPNNQNHQQWNTFMAQVVFPVDGTGAITGGVPSITDPLKASPHPMHFEDVCGAGTGCILQEGNRNLADFFKITIDASGAAEIVYDDTSNNLCQQVPTFTPTGNQTLDHCGAPEVWVVRQNGGLGLYGTPVFGPSSAPSTFLNGSSGDSLYPVIGGSYVPGMDMLQSSLSLVGTTLTVKMKVADLTDLMLPSKVGGAPFEEYVTRWTMLVPGSPIPTYQVFYAGMVGNATTNAFYAGPMDTSDLCSVSACFPHVLLYPEGVATAPGSPINGHGETGSVTCPKPPAVPSANNPCEITISVNTADVGGPTPTTLLQQVGAYSFAASHLQAEHIQAQSQADNVPVLIDGVCCYNFQQAQPENAVPEFPAPLLALLGATGVGAVALDVRRRRRRAAPVPLED